MVVAEVTMTTQHHHSPVDSVRFSQEFWDARYRSAERLWSGRPNAQLVAQASGLPPGEALDAGCGEGADAIWLASRGWTVTAADVSAVALERAAAHAEALGEQVAGRISWRHEDLYSWDPGPQRYDLVSAQFMHLPGPALAAMHYRLAAAVRPGGTLLVVTHHPDDLHANVGRTGPPDMFPSVDQLAEALDPGRWEILVASAIERPATDLDGRPVTVKDTVMRAVRRG
jgi:2-polyprenyl-3-methyl-5-hydroxy-6-metoxy-1,4-benzoquinol methylase